MEWLDLLGQHSDDQSFNLFHFSPPRLDVGSTSEWTTTRNALDRVELPVLPERATIDHQENDQEAENDVLELLVEPSSKWTIEENREFEKALAEFTDPSSPTFFEKVGSRIRSKSILDIKNRYQAMVEDIEKIEYGVVEPPECKDTQHECGLVEPPESTDTQHECGPVEPPEYKDTQQGDESSTDPDDEDGEGSSSDPKPNRKRGVPWTEEEHKLFLEGLHKFGKGDWRSISRYYLASKTPSQVASHAQKFFRRLNVYSITSTYPYFGSHRRRSIHDVRRVTSTTTTTTAAAISIPPPALNFKIPEQPVPPSMPLTSIFNNANNSRKRSHDFLEHYQSSSSSLPITSRTTVSLPPLKHVHLRQTVLALPSQNSSSTGNAANARNYNHSRSRSLLNYECLSTFGSPITSPATTPNHGRHSTFGSLMTTTTTLLLSDPKGKNVLHCAQSLPPQNPLSYSSRINIGNNNLENRRSLFDFHHSSTITPPMASTAFSMMAPSTIQQRYSTGFPSTASAAFTPSRMTSTAFPMAGCPITTASQYPFAFNSSNSFLSPPITTTLSSSSRSQIMISSSTIFPVTSVGPARTMNQQYLPSSSSLFAVLPMNTTTTSTVGPTIIRQQPSPSLPSSSSSLQLLQQRNHSFWM